ncbi:YfiT family bacillithiol transferase [Bacillus coahuilensis]|uniref:YfiT family bacillithiol transferase n=1 Tax=Bacillus coahuilensis TaxID=408580 RepID=UPI000185109C|nr:bacillithiol transferase BstA [Bacillus coahuilensis]
MNQRYPIGQYEVKEIITKDDIKRWIHQIEGLPSELHLAVAILTDDQLDTPYREGGWTVRQVVHHLADSHMNAYLRVKLALTEDNPIIKPYDEVKWAELVDYTLPVHLSFKVLEGVHGHWALLLQNLSENELKRTFIHPDSGEGTIAKNIGMYAWHGRHHLEHILSLRKRMKW